ncbi:MAG: Rne/Rng family ribonuclease [Actinomycetes bacterium]
MLDSDAPAGATPESTESAAPGESTPPPPRRRRAASRPAGPPRSIEPTPPPAEIAPPESEPDSVEAEWTEVATDTPIVEAAVDEPAVDEPSVEEMAPGQAVDEVSAVQPGEPETDEGTAEEQTAEERTAEEQEPTAEEPREQDGEQEQSPVEAIEAALDAETESDLDAEVGQFAVEEGDGSEPAEPDQEPAPPARRRTTRGRGRRAAASADADAASEGTDSVAEGLAQLGAEQARGASDAPAQPFSTVDVSAALDDLAAAIGGEEEAGAEGGDDSEDTGADDAGQRRRRRRRGGRRRRRGADQDDSADESGDDGEDAEDREDSGADADEEGGPSESEADADEGDASEGDTDESGASAASGRRRRRRRRRGEDTGTTEEEGVDVVVKVREPRRSRAAADATQGERSDQITGIEGSTRMEAKRQRRREGRAAGRRRAPILSEAEFLARRESVDRQMLIRQADDYTQIAVLEEGILVEHYVDRASSASLIGNVYLGRVQNVLPSMEAAFVDIGRGRNAVIYADEVDWDAFGVTGDDRKVEKVLKSGQSVLVQVTKDPIGAKGARLTAHISIPGRYVVYCPGGQLSGISRKLPEHERARLKAVLDDAVGTDASVIVRTAAEGASEEELVRDVSRLRAQWEVIEKKVKAGNAPQQLYTEPDLTVRIVRDLFTEDFSALVVDGNGQGEDAWKTMEAYVTHVAPHLTERLRRWDRDTEGDLFEKFRVHEQVAKALERKVHLPSGGSLIIDRTEAMTVIDVNTGKFTGSQGNLEATVTSNNLEAAEEVVRQLRLRDIGGIIVIDFIDMVLPANREVLLRRLVECLGRDRTRHQVAEVTSLGLVQMTRKKIGTGLAEAFTVTCETCAGRGYHVHDVPVATQSPSDGGDRDAGRRGAPRTRGARPRVGRPDNAPVPDHEPEHTPEPEAAPAHDRVQDDGELAPTPAG